MTLVDTNVLLDIATNDKRWADWSLSQLDAADSNDFFFGVATIDRYGTVCLRILSQESNAPRAHGFLCYEKSHPQYREILNQVGVIKVGQEKVIRPFK